MSAVQASPVQKVRRMVVPVCEQEIAKARMYAYGAQAVASLCGRGLHEKTVRRAHRKGEVDLASLKSVVSFILARSGGVIVTSTSVSAPSTPNEKCEK